MVLKASLAISTARGLENVLADYCCGERHRVMYG